MDSSNPLLERFRFASIVSSNLDEFFMVRVAALIHAVHQGNEIKCPTGSSPAEILAAVSGFVHNMVQQLHETILSQLLPEANGYGISLLSYGRLSPEQNNFVQVLFTDEIFPVLTPMAIDPTHPFPVLLNLSLNLGVILSGNSTGTKQRLAIVPIPSGLP